MFSPRQLSPYVHCCLFKIIYTRFILHPNKFRFFYPFTSRFKSFYLRWPKSVTAISVCPWQFQFVHGNFNLLTAISVCSRQFQFVRGNFNLVTAISICSRQFQFAHGNFNLLSAISICSRQFRNFTQGTFNFFHGNVRGIFRFAHHPISYSRRQWPCTKVKTQNQKSIFKVDLQREK